MSTLSNFVKGGLVAGSGLFVAFSVAYKALGVDCEECTYTECEKCSSRDYVNFMASFLASCFITGGAVNVLLNKVL